MMIPIYIVDAKLLGVSFDHIRHIFSDTYRMTAKKEQNFMIVAAGKTAGSRQLPHRIQIMAATFRHMN
jgi:hypothetical protein